jgi:hypothetical protein
MTENIKSKTNKKTSATYALFNYNTVSIAQACEILGISRSTACSAIKKTGVVMEGVPIMRVGKRQLISTYVLRKVLGLPNTQQTEGTR